MRRLLWQPQNETQPIIFGVYKDENCCRFTFHFCGRLYFEMHIKAIIYNKTRKYAGHTIDLELGDNSTVAEAKSKIEEITTVPAQIQWIVFGTLHLEDSRPLREYGIRDGYTIYSTPTYVEIQDMPNL